MTDRPGTVLDRPAVLREPFGPASEVLSDVLRTVRLTGAVFFEIEASAPWVAGAPSTEPIKDRVLPGSQHVLEYHVVMTGGCWARRMGPSPEPPVRLGPGSIVVFPHGDPHVLSSEPDLSPPPVDLSEYRRPESGESLPFPIKITDRGGETTRLVCGFLGCDAAPFNPLIAALPRMLHIEGAASADGGWLGSLIQATLAENRGGRLASGGLLAKLSEVIFTEAIRRYAESLPNAASGWLAAIGDPQIGRAIRLMHAEPDKPWTLADLSRQVGVSRTVLAERFAARLGAPPIAYLKNWRMQIAESLLAGSTDSIAQIAAKVGYESEAAFSRAFKRCTGVSPAVRRAGVRR